MRSNEKMVPLSPPKKTGNKLPSTGYPLKFYTMTQPVKLKSIAVPGLGFDADWSWTWKGQGGQQPPVNWLKDPEMLPAVVPNSRIITYSFEPRWHSKAPKIRLELCGEELVKILHNYRTDVLERPLIFIAHSLGGLVVLYALLYADRSREFKYLPERTVGFVALGTPFTGTRMRGLNEASLQLTSPISFRTSVTIARRRHKKKHLQDKTHAFCQLRDKLDLPICCFIELHAINYGKRFGIPGLIRGRTVNEKSAHVPGWDRVFLHSDHLNLNKFSDPNDRSFLEVSNAIHSMRAHQRSLLERRKLNGYGCGKEN
ncbi:hypothetical protein F4814DRAFT_98206 [Daldinia grandis]|nr:hypothetical protein F4814DRAFT_98206 [Daldinia grandis]